MKQRTRAVMTLVCSLGLVTSVLAASEAEYATRWDPAQGGPKTAASALSGLGLGNSEQDSFEIRYAVLPTPPSMRKDVKVILRERYRTNKSRHELTYKLRSNSPLPTVPSLANGHCPAGPGAKAPKDQIDVTFSDAAVPARAYSRSCTVESKSAPPPVPAALQATFAPCTSAVTRLEAGRLKVEEWHLTGGRRLIEVSRTGPDTQVELESFRREVVDPLVKVHQVRPLRASKTETGSECGT